MHKSQGLLILTSIGLCVKDGFWYTEVLFIGSIQRRNARSFNLAFHQLQCTRFDLFQLTYLSWYHLSCHSLHAHDAARERQETHRQTVRQTVHLAQVLMIYMFRIFSLTCYIIICWNQTNLKWRLFHWCYIYCFPLSFDNNEKKKKKKQTDRHVCRLV